ncbi:MAG: hypothetical protein M1813_002533 [Trichoglossum hirsutum]|nr:MAG: hypothetical protein M1813_002533 [Trichoglossum hirsutum]
MANIALTANCFDTPTFTFYDKIYDDVWAARATLCTKGAPGISCGDSFGSTIRCQVKVGNVYAAMEGTTGKAGSDDMYKYCMDALDNINNQCVYSNKIGGNWHYGKNSYWLQPIVIGAKQ